MVVQADHQAVPQQPLRSLPLPRGQAGGVRGHPAELGRQLEAAEVLARGEVGVRGVAALRLSVSHRMPRPISSPSAATAGELVMNMGKPSAGEVMVSSVSVPSMLPTVPRTCPSVTASPT